MVEPAPLQQVGRTHVRIGSRHFSYFAGCDYFRLASHPRVLSAVKLGLRRFGLNVSASRLTTGNHEVYTQLERELKGFFKAPDAILISTGYMAGIVAAEALTGNFSHALLDEAAHPALVDASRLLDCPVLRFKTRSPSDVARQVGRCGPMARIVLLTDGMFSHDGSAAPLRDYRSALPEDALMIVDDAHGAGVLGRQGRGTLEHAGVPRRGIIQTITLSKAFGSFGGVILGDLRKAIVSRSRAFAGSTPLPPPLAQAGLESVRLLARGGIARARLHSNAASVKEALREAGFPLGDKPGPIVPLIPDGPKKAAFLRRVLLAAGIFPPFIKYPGGPDDGYFRFVISSEHTPFQLRRLTRALVEAGPEGFSCERH